MISERVLIDWGGNEGNELSGEHLEGNALMILCVARRARGGFLLVCLWDAQ